MADLLRTYRPELRFTSDQIAWTYRRPTADLLGKGHISVADSNCRILVLIPLVSTHAYPMVRSRTLHILRTSYLRRPGRSNLAPDFSQVGPPCILIGF